MASTSLLNRIDSYVQSLIQDEVQELWEHSDKIAKKFKLKLVSVDGTTRIILKEKCSRTVIKVGYPSHNKAEYSVYKALEHSPLGDLFAPCLNISGEGFALEMSYIPKAIPQAKGEHYWFNPSFAKLRDKLESHFSFIKKFNNHSWGADFHEENMRVERNGNIKIIDYSNLLVDMFSRNSKTTISKTIKSLLKLDYPKVNISLTLKNRIISYQDNDISYDVSVDPSKSEAII